MINVHKDSPADFSDNDRYDDLDFTTGLREFRPPQRKPLSARALGVIIVGTLAGQTLIIILYEIWRLIYCLQADELVCRKLLTIEPVLIGFILFAVPVILVAYAGLTIYTRYLQDRAIARRTGLVLDRYGDQVPAALLEQQEIAYYEKRYAMAAHMQVKIAPYQIYKGVNTLQTSTSKSGGDRAAMKLLADMLQQPNGGAPAALSSRVWKDALEDAPHLLIYGPSKAGKSTLAQAIVAEMRADYCVIDPIPNKPGEQKWGGIDFITAMQTDDEFGAIRCALSAIEDEDKARRATMNTMVHKPLVIIIDEVLGLVANLGMTKESGRNEAVMSRFVRMMGYSARHRNIKIIIIGQGKNLSDLALDSATARNNYTLLRVSRNPATDARSAAIITDAGEQSIDISDVYEQSQAVATQANVWRTHQDMVNEWEAKKTMLHADQSARDTRALELFSEGASIRAVGATLRAEGYTVSNSDLTRLKRASDE